MATQDNSALDQRVEKLEGRLSEIEELMELLSDSLEALVAKGEVAREGAIAWEEAKKQLGLSAA